MKTIVLISGKQGSGKSTLASALVKEYQYENARIVKLAQPLYDMHLHIGAVMVKYGLEIPEKDGKLLQLLGTEWGRDTYGTDVWVDALLYRISTSEDDFFIVDDVRFRNELSLLQWLPTSRYNVFSIRLEADRDIRKTRCNSWRDNELHPSEIDLDNHGVWDIVLNTDKLPSDECLTAVKHIIEEGLLDKQGE